MYCARIGCVPVDAYLVEYTLLGSCDDALERNGGVEHSVEEVGHSEVMKTHQITLTDAH